MRIIEKFELHNELNPKIWEDNKLRKEVYDKLVEIIDQFILELHQNDIPIKVIDARIVGSNASFNYTDKSDIDVHLIANFKDSSCDLNVLSLLYNYFKSNFNDKYDLSIHGLPVEMYIEDMNSSAISNGIYSIYKDEWISFPKPIEIPDIDITDNFKPFEDKYNEIVKSPNAEKAEDLIDELYLLRKDSLSVDGEYGIGNLIFKEFRDKGYLDNLKKLIIDDTSKELSLEALNEDNVTINLESLLSEVISLWNKSHNSRLTLSTIDNAKGLALFILPSGNVLSGFNAHYEIEEVIQALGKSNYQDVDISSDNYYMYSTLSDLGCIRCRLDQYENYFQLSQIRPTYEQYDTIEALIDLMQQRHISNRVFIETPNKQESKAYLFDNYTTDEIINRIKRYYTSGKLYENKQLTEKSIDRTVLNALQNYSKVADKYGENNALFELKYKYHLQDDELVYIINKCIEKELMSNDTAKWNIHYLNLEDYLPDIKFSGEDDQSLSDIAKEYGVELKNLSENVYTADGEYNPSYIDKNDIISETVDLNKESSLNESKSIEWIKDKFIETFSKYNGGNKNLLKAKIDDISEGEWEDIEDFVNSLNFPLVIYRGLKTKSIEDINLSDIGVNWTIDDELFFDDNSAFKNSNYILVTKINENQIDWGETIQNYIYYSLRPQEGRWAESEVTLKSNFKLNKVIVTKKENGELIPITKIDLNEGYLDDDKKFWDYGTHQITDNNQLFDISTNELGYGRKMLELAKSGKEDSNGKRAKIIQMSPKEYFEACADGFGNTVQQNINQIKDDRETLKLLTDVIEIYNRQFPITFLDYSDSTFSQEGRHRMYIAGERLGWDTKFPVLVIYKKGHNPSRLKLNKNTDVIDKINDDELVDFLDIDDLTSE